jgi:non-specific serine/threonine protein kinase
MPTSFPQPLTSFVGRDWELRELADLLPRHRLLTLVGAGGCGKTRLAIELVRRQPGLPTDRIWFVDLAAVENPAYVEAVIATAVGVVPSGEDVSGPIARRLSEGPCLLVLDTCEHLLEPSSSVVSRLLGESESLTVIATSRQPLEVEGELRWTVPSLTFPEGGRVLTLAELQKLESVRLFVDRARLTRPSFKLDAKNAAAVSAICARLDGIPLAIELAAAWVRVLAPEEISRRLEKGFELLTAGRGANPRHQTLDSALRWSHDLLADVDRILLHRLAVFAGTFDVAACEDVCGGATLGREGVVHALARLVDQSMVEVVAAETRFRLLDTIRDYARVRLAESDEAAKYDRRHALYYLGIADEAYRRLRGPGRLEWQNRLELESANLRKALEWANSHDPDTALRLAYLVAPHLVNMMGGDVQQADAWLDRALANSAASSKFRGWALNERGWVAWRQGDVATAETHWKAALETFRLAGDDKGMGEAFSQLGEIAGARGDLPRSRRWLEEGLAYSRHAGDEWMAAYARFYLGLLAIREGHPAVALASLAQSLGVWRSMGDDFMTAYPIAMLGFAALELNDLPEARSRFEEALAITQSHRYDWGNAVLLQFFGALAVALKDPHRALLLLSAADAAFERNRSAPSPFFRPALEPWLKQAQKAVPPMDVAALRAEGRRMTVDQAIALIESMPRAEPPPPGGLSRREVQVVELVARGLASKEIAAHLHISTRTVDTHVDHIRAKLGLRSKAQIAAWAIEHGLRT